MRTDASWVALQRDRFVCQYHLHACGVTKDATDPHHMFGRMNDDPKAIISLCSNCHSKVHNGQIPKYDVIEIQISRGLMSREDAGLFERRKRVAD